MKTTTRWLAGTLAGCIAVGAGGYTALVRPQQSTAGRIDAQAAAERGTQVGLRAQVAVLTAEAGRLGHERALLAKAQGYLPTTPSLPALIRQLSSATDAAGVDLVSVDPSDPALLTTGSASPGAVYQIPLSLTLAGGYFQLESFLSNLESLPRALMVTGVSINPQGGTATGSTAATSPTTGAQVGTGELSVTLTARVFLTTTNLTGAAGATAGS